MTIWSLNIDSELGSRLRIGEELERGCEKKRGKRECEKTKEKSSGAISNPPPFSKLFSTAHRKVISFLFTL
ncbi:hypothetical protein Lal_00048079 [Lupinus albus]|nr:hypothetical protein Lal_00048079 [Lupinus albus]